MARPTASPPLAAVPPELARALALNAARDADRVALFLDTLVARAAADGTSRAPLRLPGWFLLELGAALRLWIWEHSGISTHRDAGLPHAGEALRAVFHRLRVAAGKEAADADTPLSRAVMALFVEHFAWSGQQDLDADFLLGEADEDDLVDTLADLLWTHRKALRRGRPDPGSSTP
jgi:hypothetical protein